MVGTGGRFWCPAIGFIFGGSLRRRTCTVDRMTLCALFALAITLGDVGRLQAQSQAAQKSSAPGDIIVTVTPDNFRRAETDLIFSDLVKRNGLGRLVHQR